MIHVTTMRSIGLVRRILVAGVCVLGAAGCGDDPAGPGPLAIPDLVGTYAGTWQTSVRIATGGMAGVTCPGSVIVAEQDADGALSGFWTQIGTTECSAASGSLAGSVAAGGTLTITELVNASGRTFEESTGCVVVAGDDNYTGTADATRFEISKTVTADCAGTEFTFTWRLGGAKVQS